MPAPLRAQHDSGHDQPCDHRGTGCGDGGDAVTARTFLDGQGGHDTAFGGAGVDDIVGGSGADRSYGDVGTDTCTGELGDLKDSCER
ncbi:hypothetical protein [Streptomyces sp. NPDC002324]